MKQLIITADDFGMSKNINKAILKLCQEKFLTSVSVMVNEVTREDISTLHACEVSKGLHLELEEACSEEIMEKQLAKFKELFNTMPDYVDIHKGPKLEHTWESVANFAKKHHLPTRNHGASFSDVNMPTPFFFGTEKSFEEICDWLKNLNEGVHEIVFHPGYFEPDLPSRFRKEREEDIGKVEELSTILASENIQSVSYTVFHKL